MEHVKQEVAKNPEKAKDWEKVAQTAAQVSSQLGKAKDSASKAKDLFDKVKAAAGAKTASSTSTAKPTNQSMRYLKNKVLEHPMTEKTKAAVVKGMDKFQQVVLKRFQEDDKAPELSAKWHAFRMRSAPKGVDTTTASTGSTLHAKPACRSAGSPSQ